jgi:hypothetical protein
MSAPALTLKALAQGRELTLNDYASIATDALAAINAKRQAWQDDVKRGGYVAHFKAMPRIHDEIELQLYEAITEFDDDAAGTLEEIRFQNEPRERDLIQWPLLNDEEFDFATSRGITA